MRIKQAQIALMIAVALVGSVGCKKELPPGPTGNLAPQTYLALFPFPDSLFTDTLAYTTSRQQLSWWGDDPDGFVVAYRVSTDGISWTLTARTDSLFVYRFNGQDTIVRFYSAAVDNLGAVDPTPATIFLPMRNTPPTVQFQTGTEVPETTFTVATFSWIGRDLDGDDTIDRYVWALDDTLNPSKWRFVPRATTLLTLFRSDSLVEGNHIFYIRAQDQAGALSPWIRMPDTNRVWYVKEPRTVLLVVDDYAPTSDNPTALYRAVFDTIGSGRYRDFDVWDIKTGKTSTTRGRYVPAYIDPTIVETLKLFRYVLWYTDNTPSTEIMSLALFKYRLAAGKIILSITLPSGVIDPRGVLVDFAPVDSVSADPLGVNCSPNCTGFIPSNTPLNPDSVNAPGYPTLVRDGSGVPVAFVRSFVPKTPGGVALYRLPLSGSWTGTPIVGVGSTQGDFFLMGMPLHRLNGGSSPSVGTFLYKVVVEEFGG